MIGSHQVEGRPGCAERWSGGMPHVNAVVGTSFLGRRLSAAAAYRHSRLIAAVEKLQVFSSRAGESLPQPGSGSAAAIDRTSLARRHKQLLRGARVLRGRQAEDEFSYIFVAEHRTLVGQPFKFMFTQC